MLNEMDKNKNFICIINNMKKKIKEEFGENFSDGEFLLMAYGWNREFAADVEMIKKGCEGFAEVNCANAYGYKKKYRLCRPEPAENWAFLKDGPRHRANNIFSVERLYIKNDAENCSRAAEYFYELYGGRDLEQIRNIAIAASEGIGEKFSERDEFAANAMRDDHNAKSLFGLWGNILIYAQTGEKRVVEETTKTPEPNIYLAAKGEIENRYAFEERTRHADRQILVNYASTSFILNKSLSDVYDPNWELSFTDFVRGRRDISIVLTCPFSAAERDAVRYKMKPKNLKVKGEQIILSNLINLQEKIRHYPDCRVRVFLTDIAMPCGYFLNECSRLPEKSNIKVDLYLPNFGKYENRDLSLELENQQKSDAEVRQSFVIYDRGETKKVFADLRENITDILEHSRELHLRDIPREQLADEIRRTAKELENEQRD